MNGVLARTWLCMRGQCECGTALNKIPEFWDPFGQLGCTSVYGRRNPDQENKCFVRVVSPETF